MRETKHEIDYDAETILFEDTWYSRDDLARRIKAMIDRGDYRVATPSSLLERLESALAGARVVAARVSPELAEAVETRAVREGRSVSSVVREALERFLSVVPRISQVSPRAEGGRPVAAVAKVAAPAPSPAARAAAAAAAAPVAFATSAASVATVTQTEEPEMDETWFGG